jgi:hypothetical protein
MSILILKSAHPHPIHGQPDGVLAGQYFKKACFFAFFYRILIKKSVFRKNYFDSIGGKQ